MLFNTSVVWVRVYSLSSYQEYNNSSVSTLIKKAMKYPINTTKIGLPYAVNFKVKVKYILFTQFRFLWSTSKLI